MFTLTIETDNAAFESGNCSLEVSRILEEIAKDLERMTPLDDSKTWEKHINDLNGNKVCKATFEA